MRLIPRDEQFYTMFSDLATRIASSARLLGELFDNPGEMDRFVGAIKAIEHEADNIIHEITTRIDKSFVTPFDREDIYLLASRLDTVVDLIDGVARRAQMFHIVDVRAPAHEMCGVLIRAGDCIVAAVSSMKQPKIVNTRARELKILEEEGDAIYHDAVGGLFAGSPDPLEVIKWKELYDTLEGALDQCEDVANTLESISLKNA